MSFDPVLFDSTMYETANEAVLFCREYLEKNGNADAACALQNFEAITGADMALLALEALAGVQKQVRGPDAAEYVQMAIYTLERALAAFVVIGEAPRSAA